MPGGQALLIDESYNANPASMRATLAQLGATPASRRIAVLGSMKELGDFAPAFHAQLAEPLEAAGVDYAILVGEEMVALARELGKPGKNALGIPLGFAHCQNPGEAIAALEEFDPYWFEDPVKMTNMDALAQLARSTRVPICASETLAGRPAFLEMMQKQAAGIVMLDLSWVGGLSEAKKIATMAEAFHLPVAPHDCTGPVVFIASCHLSLNAPNALIQESVRAYYTGWYRELVTELPRIDSPVM